jgi:hypothetical protein
MRRFELSATHRAEIDRSPADVLGFLENLGEALSAFPYLGEVHELEPHTRYALEVGPFGVGSFQGTVRVNVRVTRTFGAIIIESVEGEGNTDVRARIEAYAPPGESEGATTRVRMDLWASPRREVPALLPVSLVRSIATRTVERGLAEGARGLKTRLEHRDAGPDAAKAPAI